MEVEVEAEEEQGGPEEKEASEDASHETAGEEKEEGRGEGSEGEAAGEGKRGKKGEELGEMEHIDIAIGCMLLGSIAMQMGLLYLVNYPDEDIMKSSWEVISSTVSIFVSVLIFHALLGLATAIEEHHTQGLKDEKARLTGGWAAWISIGFSFLFFMFIFMLMHVIIAAMVKAHRFDDIDGERSSEFHSEVVSFSAGQPETAKQRRKRITKSWAILLAHTASFAGIHLGVRLQALSLFERSHISTFLVPMLMGSLFFVLFRISDWVRSQGSEGLSLEAHEAWDEEAEEAEKDIASIALSFLTCQAARYCIVGVLARSNGMEVPQEVHPWSCVFILMLAGVGFYLTTAIMVTLIACEAAEDLKTKDGCQKRITLVHLDHVSHTGLDPMHVYVVRWYKIFPKITASCGSWCLLWSCKWGQLLVPQPGGVHFDKNSTVMFVSLALFVSFVMFILILVLDFLADLQFTGPICDVSLRAIIDSLGVLVGYTWELSFSSGLEGIAELTAEGFGQWAPLFCQILLALIISIVVVPAWRANILKKVLELQAIEAARDSVADTMDVVWPWSQRRTEISSDYESLAPAAPAGGDGDARSIAMDVHRDELATSVGAKGSPRGSKDSERHVGFSQDDDDATGGGVK